MDGRTDEETGPLLEPVIKPLYSAFQVLLAAREMRGALDLDLPERLVKLGEDGRIAEIGTRDRLDSHKLIEEFMVLANVAAAQALEQRHMPCLYRAHDQPDATKVEALREFLGTLGIAVPIGQRLRPADLNRVLKQVEGKPVARPGQRDHPAQPEPGRVQPEQCRAFRPRPRALRPLHLADPPLSRPDRASRADLGLRPGRRRLARRGQAALRGVRRTPLDVRAPRRRGRARRDGPLCRRLHAGHVGATFPGRVTSVTRFGLFLALDGTGADGLLPIRSLGTEFFRHEEGRQMLVGERTGESFGLGDRLGSSWSRADAATGGLLFELVEILERVERQSLPRGTRGENAATGRIVAARVVRSRTERALGTNGRDDEPDRTAHLGGMSEYPSVDLWTAMRRGAKGLCPRCGEGALFSSFLKMAPRCSHCGLVFEPYRADDAPAYFTILLVGHIVVPMVLMLERYGDQPPLWFHALLWLPLSVISGAAFASAYQGRRYRPALGEPHGGAQAICRRVGSTLISSPVSPKMACARRRLS